MAMVRTDDSYLDPVVISIGTCRALRIVKRGLVYFVENGHLTRNDNDSEEVVWKTVAVAKGTDAHNEAHAWLSDANKEVMRMIQEDTARK